MELGLKNKVAIVSGASKGIGLAISRALAREGVKVVLCSRGKEALGQARDSIEREGGIARAVSADLTKPAQVKKVVTAALKTFGRIDIIINNAGGAERFGAFEDLTSRDWSRAYQLNVLSAVELARSALPALRKSPSARIINISSLVGLQPGTHNPHYAAAKAALINVSKALANQLAPRNILVNVVCAGPVYSDAWDRNVKYVAKLKDQSAALTRKNFDRQEAAKIPLGRIGRPQDISGLVVFLASEQAAWITGSCFVVDGGKQK